MPLDTDNEMKGIARIVVVIAVVATIASIWFFS